MSDLGNLADRITEISETLKIDEGVVWQRYNIVQSNTPHKNLQESFEMMTYHLGCVVKYLERAK